MQQDIKDRILKPREFKSRADVLTWFRELLDAGVNFHPEDSGGGLIDIETEEPTFTKDEARRYDELMEAVYTCCSIKLTEGCNPCVVACEAFDQWLADQGLCNDVQRHVFAKIPDRDSRLQRLVRAVVWHMVDGNTADHSGYDKREAIEELCQAVGITPPAFEEDEAE